MLKKTSLIFLSAAAAALGGVAFARTPLPFSSAVISEAINDVKIVNAKSLVTVPAQASKQFDAPDLLRTGRRSLAQLQMTDGTVVRVGSQAVFSFEEVARTIRLQSGTMLFHSPKGKGGGTIVTNSATASVVGTTIMVTATSDGGFKLMVLEGTGRVVFPNGQTSLLKAGQLIFVLPQDGDFTRAKPGPVLNFDLDAMVKESKLINGFSAPIASTPQIQEAVGVQRQIITEGGLSETGLVIVGASGEQDFSVVDLALLRQQSIDADYNLHGGQQGETQPDPDPSPSPNPNPDPDPVPDPGPDPSPDVVLGQGAAIPEQFVFRTPTAVPGAVSYLGEVTGVVARTLTFGNGQLDLQELDGLSPLTFVADKLVFSGTSELAGLAETKSVVLFGQSVENVPESRLTIDFTGDAGSLAIRSVETWSASRLTLENKNGSLTLRSETGDLSFSQSALSATGADGELTLFSSGTLTLDDTAVTAGAGMENFLLEGAQVVIAGGALAGTADTNIAIRADDVVTLTGTAISGKSLTIISRTGAWLDSLTLDGVTLSPALTQLELTAATVSLANINIPSGVIPVIRSTSGLLNIDGTVTEGAVNFLSGVLYNGTVAQDAVYAPLQNIGDIESPIHILPIGVEDLRISKAEYALGHPLEYVTVNSVEEIANNFVFRRAVVLEPGQLTLPDWAVTDAGWQQFVGLMAQSMTLTPELLNVSYFAGADFSGMTLPTVRFYGTDLVLGSDISLLIPNPIRRLVLEGGTLANLSGRGLSFMFSSGSSQDRAVFLRSNDTLHLDNALVEVANGGLALEAGNGISAQDATFYAVGPGSNGGVQILAPTSLVSLSGGVIVVNENESNITVAGREVSLDGTILQSETASDTAAYIAVRGTQEVRIKNGKLWGRAVTVSGPSDTEPLENLEVDGTDFFGPGILGSGESPSTVMMAARTIIVRNVNFAQGSQVTLASQDGVLNIQSSGTALFGAVNFGGNVKYNGVDLMTPGGVNSQVWVQGGSGKIFVNGAAQGGSPTYTGNPNSTTAPVHIKQF